MRNEDLVKIAGIVVVVVLLAANLFYIIQLQGSIANLENELALTNSMQDMIIEYADIGDQMEEYLQKSELIRAAMNEGKLTLYCTHTVVELMAYVEAFHARYPFIEIEYYRSAAAGMSEKIESEYAAGLYIPDVLFGATGILAYLNNEGGYLAEYVSPEEVNYPEWARSTSTKRFVAQRDNIIFMMVNTESVPEALWPTDYLDFIDPRPEWTGLTSVNDGRFTEYGYQLIYTLDKYLGRDTARQVWEGIRQTQPKMYTSMGIGSEMCISGERPICTAMSVFSYGNARDEGIPVQMIVPSSGMPTAHSGIAVFEKAPNPNAARLFYDWFLSEEGAQLGVDRYFVPLREGMEPLPLIPSFDEFNPWPVDETDMMNSRSEIIALWTEWMGLA